MPKVSVIIPVYMAEQYICECLDSIKHQTFTDWECLLIDDGSPDNSGSICDEYASSDSRFKVFHKTNGGVSSARNYGLLMSMGEWVTFVDADDWIELDTMEKCSPYFEDFDIIRFGVKYYMPNTSVPQEQSIDISLTREDFLNKVVSRDVMLGVCSGLYRKSLFNSNDMSFDENISMGEDWQVLIKTIVNSVHIKLLPNCFYCYNRMNENSCVSTDNFYKSFQCQKVLSWIINSEQLKTEIKRKSIERCKFNLSYHFLCIIKTTGLGVKEYRIVKKESYPTLLSIVFNKATYRMKAILLMCYTKIGFCLWNRL